MKKSRYLFILSLVALIGLGSLPTLAQAGETNCIDKKDDDGDGFIDCADRDCQMKAKVCERREDWEEGSVGDTYHMYPDTISVIAAIIRGDSKILLSRTETRGTYVHSSTRLYQDLEHKGNIEAVHYLVKDPKNPDYYNYFWTITDLESGARLETFMIETPIPVGISGRTLSRESSR